MKRLTALLLAGFLMISLCACQKAPVTESPAVGTSAPAAPAEPTAPLFPAELQTTSRMAGTMQRAADGTLWTSVAPVEGMEYVYDSLPENAGFVYSFVLDGDRLYAAVKDDRRAMDGTRIYAVDTATGESTLLTDDGSGACVFCLVGSSTIVYQSEEGGLRALNLETAQSGTIMASTTLLAAQDGWFYYTTDDGALYRNNSTLTAEEKLLDICPSYWIVTGGEGMCDLAYAGDDTVLLEFRALDGTLRAQVTLSEPAGSLYTDGDLFYAPLPAGGAAEVYSLSDGSNLGAVPLMGSYDDILILHAGEDALYFRAMEDGCFNLYRADSGATEAVLLAENID